MAEDVAGLREDLGLVGGVADEVMLNRDLATIYVGPQCHDKNIWSRGGGGRRTNISHVRLPFYFADRGTFGHHGVLGNVDGGEEFDAGSVQELCGRLPVVVEQFNNLTTIRYRLQVRDNFLGRSVDVDPPIRLGPFGTKPHSGKAFDLLNFSHHPIHM